MDTGHGHKDNLFEGRGSVIQHIVFFPGVTVPGIQIDNQQYLFLNIFCKSVTIEDED